MTWHDFERAAPALAQAARARLEATRIALLGTIRADGSPRISPIEPYFTQKQLLLGAMTRSLKARELTRDSRCVVHSAISAPDAGEPEFKLYGTVSEVTDTEERQARADAWWLSHPADAARVFTFAVAEAVSVEWALERGEMTVTRWSVQRGLDTSSRSYP
jgi:hypothetical protein